MITVAFQAIKEDANQDDANLKRLLVYFERTWLKSSIWPLKSITVYHRLVRTNNDVEGYHTRLNAKSNGDHPPFYDLIEDLRKEAKYVDITMKLVSNQAVKSHRKRKTKEVQRMICLA